MNFFKISFVSTVLVLGGCSSLPDVVVKDRLADDRTRSMVHNGVRVVKAEHAKQFDDPAWPTPVQVVVPRRESKSGSLSRIKEKQEVYLFQDSGVKQRIERLYVENSTLNKCRAALEGIGLAHLEYKPAFIRVGDGGGKLFRCGSVVIESDTNDLVFRHPFISTYSPVDLADLNPAQNSSNESGYLSDGFDAENDILRRYPLLIRYLDDE